MELEVVRINIIDGKFIIESEVQAEKRLEPIEGTNFPAVVFTEVKTTEQIRLWMVMQHDDNYVIGVFEAPIEKMNSWLDYKKLLVENKLTLESINTIFMLNEDGEILVTMSRFARNDMLTLVKKAYAQVEHLLAVPVEVNV